MANNDKTGRISKLSKKAVVEVDTELSQRELTVRALVERAERTLNSVTPQGTSLRKPGGCLRRSALDWILKRTS